MSAWYPEYLESTLERDPNSDLTGANLVKVQLVDAGYVYNATHQFFSEVPAATRAGIAVTLGSKNFTNGLFSAVCPDFVALSGDVVTGFVVYVDTGTESTSRLVMFIDDATVFPLTPSASTSPRPDPQPLCDTVSSNNIWLPENSGRLSSRGGQARISSRNR